MDSDYNYKYIIIGDTLTGKTSYFNQLIYNKFIIDKITTIGVDFGVLFLNINNKIIKNHFWDTAGQEKYKSIIRTYYRGAKGCILMFDLTNIQSFFNLKKWINDLKHYGKYDELSIIVLGNKSDLIEKREVNSEQILEFCDEEKLDYFDVSVKNNFNVKKSFEHLVNLISKKNNNFDLIDSKIEKQSFELVEYKKKEHKCLNCKIS